MDRRTPRGATRAIALLAILVGCSCQSADTSSRVIFLGIDGATWTVIEPMFEAGELPNFRRLTREGAYMPRFETIESTHSPVVWTSVATGRRPKDHGVERYTEKLPSGKVIPITSNSRKVDAIWNVATAAGRSVGVLGWWASWPPDKVNGYIITDRANPAALGLFENAPSGRVAEAAARPAVHDACFPSALCKSLESHWLTVGEFPYAEVGRLGKLTDSQLEVLRAAPWFTRSVYPWLKTSFAIDYPLLTIALQLAREQPTDLQMIYWRGPDPVQHLGWNLFEPEKFRFPPENLERDRGLVRSVYRYVDTFLGEILAAKDPHTTLIVASDHGAEASPWARGKKGARPGEHSTNAKGVLFIHGPNVKPGHMLATGDPLDLMPTMAWLLDLPLSDQLAGSPMTDAFDPAFVAAKKPRTVPAYGERQPGRSEASTVDDAVLEKLRSLGYIE